MKNRFDIRSAARARHDSRADAIFAPSLLVSIAVHLTAIALIAALNHRTRLTVSNAIPVTLLEPRQPQIETARDLPRPSEKRKAETPAKAQDEPAKFAESRAPAPPPQTVLSDRASAADGGAPEGAAAFSADGTTGAASGPSSGGGTGGNAVAGLGRGSGAPGVPAPPSPLRTHREAKAIQTARAVYPPMALRMGIEGDVTLRIEVDPAGSVTRAEIVKSGGAGFDEEALKAVRQSRFEPAQRDGRAVAAEFTYIYRFRLQR